ncbi:hypothetical protein HRI_004536000 [Hibiscus trionum]|uniref:Uncharacterized protein n=1 Tax=Hibiscus trionum TaxID=183268 RepID=A0A9W7J995_HIBTR|nr:hypothetical protein HRI_004536000 [Hibiscus trionum]
MKEQSPAAMASTKDSFAVPIEETLRIELGKAEKLEAKLSEQEASFHKLKAELNMANSFESETVGLMSEDKERIKELYEQIEERKESEMKLHDAFMAQSEEFEQAKISLEESKSQIKSLLEILQNWDGSSSKDSFQAFMADDRLRRLESELQSTKEKLSRAQENEQASWLKARTLAEEASYLKQELKCITDAEENNKKAMDDLALALKEVITEANEAKNKLSSTQMELEKTKGYVENLKAKMRKLEGKYREAKKEADRYKNTSERLRIEAEESLMAWNTREVGFVECIRKAEDERNAAQEECQSLLESLQEAENMKKKAKEENQKLRDIMKQAINEANVAKEAANIARAENSQLKDAIAKKDEALDFLSQENETLKINEAAARDIIEELKMFCESGNRNNKGV